ncbi:hypothetical protein D3C80_21850 [compost metagenome]
MSHLPFFCFVDKREHEEWSPDNERVIYRAEGVVTMICYPPGDRSGEDVGVLYSSPAGVLFREWRSHGEIELIEVDKTAWIAKRADIEACERSCRTQQLIMPTAIELH